jgi:hypothetical protein
MSESVVASLEFEDRLKTFTHDGAATLAPATGSCFC